MSGCKLRGINKGAEVINSTRTYTYDATGNRLSKQAGTATAVAYTYPSGPTPPASHQLLAVGTVARGYDAMGNTTSIGGAAQGFTYDDTSRMTQVKAAGAATKTYQYNALGQRVRKSHAAITSEIQKTIYDESGHPLADIDYNNNLIDEYVWMDDLPIAILSGSTSVLEYIEPDHLGTPRVAIDAATNAQSWTWPLVNDPFGETQPTGTLTLNLRFPGQTYDAESGMNYNYFRDYDSSTGRYIESDPIGLDGGITTFTYVRLNPPRFVDFTGLGQDCGSGKYNRFVPDNPFGFSFQPCCVDHDACYGCKGKAAGTLKPECDLNLRNCARNQCDKYAFPVRLFCYRIAGLYYEAVKLRGQPYYDAARAEPCPSCSSGIAGPRE